MQTHSRQGTGIWGKQIDTLGTGTVGGSHHPFAQTKFYLPRCEVATTTTNRPTTDLPPETARLPERESGGGANQGMVLGVLIRPTS